MEALTLELAVVAAVRVAGSLPVLRWPFRGGVLAVLVDLADLLLRDVLDLGGLGDYQAVDKWLDQVYLALFLVVALRWSGTERTVAVALYAFRLVGFAAFVVSGERAILLLFPNVFEVWFLLVAGLHRYRPQVRLEGRAALLALAAAVAVKEAQEWALHGARLFDGISSTEFLERIRERLFGGG